MHAGIVSAAALQASAPVCDAGAVGPTAPTSALTAAPPAAAAATAGPMEARVATRVAALQSHFARIAATRMQGVPILHPGIGVAAVGFEPGADGLGAVGVLVTPWFMNLVWLPLVERDARDRPLPALAVGATRMRAVGNERFDFIGAHEPGFGSYEACSLFSPMLDFADEATALATAAQVLAILRAPPPAPSAATAGAEAGSADAAAAADVPASPIPPTTSRRALLFGRRGAETGR